MSSSFGGSGAGSGADAAAMAFFISTPANTLLPQQEMRTRRRRRIAAAVPNYNYWKNQQEEEEEEGTQRNWRCNQIVASAAEHRTNAVFVGFDNFFIPLAQRCL